MEAVWAVVEVLVVAINQSVVVFKKLVLCNLNMQDYIYMVHYN